ncbi:MAG TPA: cell division protein FtsX, partial [Xanthomonadaceae bacterium]|nr:cell division protein FtsX [Xanthomonadaceae bacterium]
LLAVLLGNAMRFADSLGGARELSVFLEISGDAAADAAAARRIADALARRNDVAAVTLRTPDEGLAEFKRMSDLAGALDLLDGNPLPWVLLVSPAGAAAANPAALAAALQAEPGVESVQYDAAWRERLEAWLALARRAAALLALLLAAGALLVVGNTVRLDLAGRRDEIALLQLLGADDADIRRPMLHFGVLLGLLAGALALVLAAVAGLALAVPLAALSATYAGGLVPVGPGVAGALAVLGTGGALGWLGARMAAGHYLRTSRLAP